MTTGFSEDATMNYNDSRDISFNPVGSNVNDIQDIAMFLGKPYVAPRVPWTSADLSNSVLSSFSIKDILRAHLPWSRKYQGYRYMRGTAVVRLELNAQPFQAGKLLVHFLPQYGARPSFVSKLQCLAAKTQQYSVEIDCRDSAAMLRIPYISPFSHCNLLSSAYEDDWGSVFITVLSPLVSAAVTNVDVFYSLHFEDVELEAPTAQSGVARTGKARSRPNKAIISEREEVSKGGHISSTLEALVDPIHYFKDVPILGTFVNTAQNVLKGSAGIFKAFGWAKPLNTSAPMPVARAGLKNLTNFNGSNLSAPLALDAGNKLEKYDLMGGLPIDEMSFSYLKKIPAFCYSFSWSTADAPGSSIDFRDIQLESLRQTVTNTLGGIPYSTYFAPPFVYIARHFRFWRGSVNMHIKFVKTQFHTGKLVVTYDTATGAAIANDQATTSLREIIDLKDSYEVVLNLPYLSNRTYEEFAAIIGQVRIRVLNQLVATSTVSSAVQVLVYFSAGDDFEVACINDAAGVAVIAQMNVVDKQLVKRRIGGYPETELSLIPAQSSMGEVFTSLKQLLSSSRNLTRTTDVSFVTSYPSAGYNGFCFWPWIFGIPRNNSVPATANWRLPPFSGDYLSEFANGFAYYRGGIRYSFPRFNGGGLSFAFTTANQSRTRSTTIVPTAPGAFPYVPEINGIAPTATSTSDIPVQLKNCTFQSTIDAGLDITIPYQGSTPMRFTHITQNTTSVWDIPTTSDVNPDLLSITYTNSIGDLFTNSSMTRAGSDDFEFIYFVGFGGYVPTL